MWRWRKLNVTKTYFGSFLLCWSLSTYPKVVNTFTKVLSSYQVILLWSLLSQGCRNLGRQVGGQGGNCPFHIFEDHFTLETIHLKYLQIFMIFDHHTPSHWQFFTTIRLQIWPIFDPFPPSNGQRRLWTAPCRFDLDFHHPTEIFAQVIIKEFTVRQKVYEILSAF